MGWPRARFPAQGRGQLRLAETPGPLRFTWSWPDLDLTALNPTMVVISGEPDGR